MENNAVNKVNIQYRDELSTRAIEKMFDGCSRQWVFAMAQREKWTKISVAQRIDNYYARADVVNSWKAQKRTLLYKAFAYLPKQPNGSRLLRTNSMDTYCPECGAFAIRFPDTYLPTKVRPNTPSQPVTSCVAGHTIPIKEAHAQSS
jgi:hypothetical protein